MKRLLDYLGRPMVTQGEGAGGPFPVLPWERRFIRGTFRDRGDAALSVARGNGKTALVAGIAAATVDPEGPLRQRRAETVIVASSFEQARIDFEHVYAFLEARGLDLENRKRWRVWDTAQHARIECRETALAGVTVGTTYFIQNAGRVIVYLEVAAATPPIPQTHSVSRPAAVCTLPWTPANRPLCGPHGPAATWFTHPVYEPSAPHLPLWPSYGDGLPRPLRGLHPSRGPGATGRRTGRPQKMPSP